MKILISALEASANLHAKEVIAELVKYENIELCGIFEPSSFDGISNLKMNALHHSSEFSAMGFLGILHLINKAKKAICAMNDLANDADAVLLIDSPAFNIPLAKKLKKSRIQAKITYYVLPQVWAWKEYRAKIVRQNCDNLASILPFEAKFYENSTFVGHPLLDEIKLSKSPSKSGKIVFMPGSRKAEIKNLMPVFKALAPSIKEQKIIIVPPHFKGKESEIYGACDDFSFEYDANLALANADFAFICSGTATLQSALIGTPFVLCYKARAFDVFLARIFVRNLRHIGLANILFDFLGQDELHKEFIQNEVTPNALLKAYKECDKEKFASGSKKLKEYLAHGSSANVARILMEK